MGKEYPAVVLGPWPNGMNNRAEEFDLGEGELRDSVNFDIALSGRIRRRVGTNRVYSGTTRSIASTGVHLLFAEGTELKMGLPNPTTLRSDLSTDRRVSYTHINHTFYYSDGLVSGRVFQDQTHVPHWSVARPSSAPIISASAGGVLYPGRYRVKLTLVGETNEEGPSSAEAAVDIAIGEHISIDLFPLVLDPFVTHFNIYVAGPNDETFFRLAQVPVATVSHEIFSNSAAYGTLGTDLMEVVPPCEIVEHFAGRMWGITGSTVWYSESLRFGLYTPRHNFFMFPEEVTVFAPCEDGIYAVADKTYWLPGRNPKEMQLVTLGDFKGVKYSATKVRNSRTVAWFTPYGWAIGAPGGQFKIASENRIAAASYEEGATLFREERGDRQVIGNFKSGAESPFVSSDFADMEIVRRGE